jgi:hypothetical protein
LSTVEDSVEKVKQAIKAALAAVYGLRADQAALALAATHYLLVTSAIAAAAGAASDAEVENAIADLLALSRLRGREFACVMYEAGFTLTLHPGGAPPR